MITSWSFFLWISGSLGFMSSSSINLLLSTKSSGNSVTLGHPSKGGSESGSSFVKIILLELDKSLALLETVAILDWAPNPKSGVWDSIRVWITVAWALIFCWLSGEYLPILSSQVFGLWPILSTWPIWMVTAVAEKLATCNFGFPLVI